jgi:hypothetical protein
MQIKMQMYLSVLSQRSRGDTAWIGHFGLALLQYCWNNTCDSFPDVTKGDIRVT